MGKLVSITFALFLSTNAYANEGVVNSLSAFFKSEVYAGTTEDGEKCKVLIHKSSESISIAVTPVSFNFNSGEKGSSECMYEKACFKLNNQIKILSMESNGASSIINVLRPGGGAVDLRSEKKMSLILENGQKGTKVTAIERIGLFNLGSAESSCIINLN